jgi:NADP-dependent 3-hydroxy acid dehydrogenase YdfG
MSEFANKIAIVTGAATGLGEAIAVKLHPPYQIATS